MLILEEMDHGVGWREPTLWRAPQQLQLLVMAAAHRKAL